VGCGVDSMFFLLFVIVFCLPTVFIEQQLRLRCHQPPDVAVYGFRLRPPPASMRTGRGNNVQNSGCYRGFFFFFGLFFFFFFIGWLRVCYSL